MRIVEKGTRKDKRESSKRKKRDKIIIELSSSNSELLSVSRKSKTSKGYKILDINHNNRDYFNWKFLDKKRK